MEKYQQLKKFIQERNPEIMELKFGCEVQLSDATHNDPYKVRILARSQNDNPVVYHAVGMDGLGDCFCQPGLFDINLGRPIRLADVLFAADSASFPPGSLFFNANYRGNLELSGLHGQQFVKWDLVNDDLDKQSDETKDFLIKLMVQ